MRKGSRRQESGPDSCRRRPIQGERAVRSLEEAGAGAPSPKSTVVSWDREEERQERRTEDRRTSPGEGIVRTSLAGGFRRTEVREKKI